MNELDMKDLFATPRVITDLNDCYFYHTMDLPEFGLIRAHWDLRGRFDEYIGGVEVEGKSVLDIGTATGFLSFEAEKRGARVVSFDMEKGSQQTFLPFKDKAYYSDHDRWAKKYSAQIEKWKNAYWLCHRLLESNARVYYGDVYNLPANLGRFDVTIVGSVLEHLSDQVTALASIARLTTETLILVTPLLDSDEPIARFEPRASNPEHDYTWWTYSVAVYREVLGMLGFTIKSISKAEYYHDYEQRFEPRTTLVAQRFLDAQRHVIERLVATSAEGETITADDIYKALPAATLTGATSQVPIIFHDSDSLDDFLDRTMLGFYDQLLATTGSHSQAARLLRTDRVSLYQRVERARRRILNGTT